MPFPAKISSEDINAVKTNLALGVIAILYFYIWVYSVKNVSMDKCTLNNLLCL